MRDFVAGALQAVKLEEAKSGAHYTDTAATLNPRASAMMDEPAPIRYGEQPQARASAVPVATARPSLLDTPPLSASALLALVPPQPASTLTPPPGSAFSLAPTTTSAGAGAATLSAPSADVELMRMQSKK
jgi:hypothetical protein